MRNLLWAALLSSSALTTGAMAQTAPTATTPATPTTTTPMAGQPTATLADCDRLTTFLEQRRPANPGVTVEQIRTYRTGNNAQACRDALVRLDPASATTAQGAAGTDGRIVVQQTAPTIRVEQAPPQVSVMQAQPTVNVRQGVPEIIVRQAPPTITVQMPNPEIIVRMPEPEVNVAMAQPQVSVSQPKPDVQVVQPAQPQVSMSAQQQPQVNVSAAANQAPANIQVDRAQPKVTFERQGEAKIVMNQAEGQPTIRVEQAGRDGAAPVAPGATAPARTAAATTGAMTPATTAPGGATTASTSATGPMTAARLRGMDIYSQDNQKLGDVDRVVQTTDGKSFVLVGFGGFLGIGERKVAIPVEQIASRGDRLVVTSLTNDQLKALPAYDGSARGYRDAEGTYSPVFGR